VQEDCCRALTSILAGGTSGNARRQAAVDTGALNAVVAAMRTHATAVALQQYGCAALANICATAMPNTPPVASPSASPSDQMCDLGLPRASPNSVVDPPRS
jgi:hypothetical protein